MFWMSLSLVSAVLLGFYDIAKKLAARENAVPVVLLLSVSVGAAIWAPMLVLQSFWNGPFPVEWLRVDSLSLADHALLFAKSVLVGTSWTCALFALKHLPLSIAAPIRSTSPFWTIAIAICFLGERPTPIQWVGIVVVLVSFWAFSLVGKTEGIQFNRDRWVGLMLMATIQGAISSIYDKILLQRFGYTAATVQAWFTIYLVPVMVPAAAHWWGKQTTSSDARKFEFRRSIFWISPLLLAADMVYFTALSSPEALVSIVSTLRRCSVVVALIAGTFIFREANIYRKSVCIGGILVGIALILL